MNDRYEALANAIIVQAADDYKDNYRKLEALLNTDTKGMNDKARSRYNRQLDKANDAFDETREFFYSDWFGMLTNIDPDIIVRKLDKECGNE